ncbi:haloacid dehalogenase [bacterium]|nr:MAG: haloacid dehalogenase [bacterium]
MSDSLLLCTDLDRTLLPNGDAPESPRARELFSLLCAQPLVTVVYVTGRDAARVEAARQQYGLPVPDYVVADVGSTIMADDGVRWQAWDDHIAGDWHGLGSVGVQEIVGALPGLARQDDSRQGRFKSSYEVGTPGDLQAVATAVAERLRDEGLIAAVVASHDEVADVGLIDVLPGSAGKGPAIEFLRRHLGLGSADTVFAGDSGNDLDVLAGPLPAVLVANAASVVREQAVREAAILGHADLLYLAGGGVLGLNGNYAAGILEGVLHYHPAWAKVLEEAT